MAARHRATPTIANNYRYQPGGGTNSDRVASEFLTELFGTRETLQWVSSVREEAIAGTLLVNEERQDGVQVLPVMLGSPQPLMRDAACANIVHMLYENDGALLRQQLAEAGFNEYRPGSVDCPNPRYTFLDTGTDRTNGGVSMHEGIMITDESISPPRITVLYRGTHEREDFMAHVEGSIDYARGRTIGAYTNDYGVRLNRDGSYTELQGEQLADVTHPLIQAEIERLRATNGSNVDVTFFGHSLGADPAARDAAYFNTQYPDMVMDYVGAAPTSSFSERDRRLMSQQIRGREFEIYNEDDPLNGASNFFRRFNNMDSLGSGSDPDARRTDEFKREHELRIQVPAQHRYEDSLFLEALRVSAEERRKEPGGEAWFRGFMSNFAENVPAAQREAAVRNFIREEMGDVNAAYCLIAARDPDMHRALAQFQDPSYQPAHMNEFDANAPVSPNINLAQIISDSRSAGV